MDPMGILIFQHKNTYSVEIAQNSFYEKRKPLKGKLTLTFAVKIIFLKHETLKKNIRYQNYRVSYHYTLSETNIAPETNGHLKRRDKYSSPIHFQVRCLLISGSRVMNSKKKHHPSPTSFQASGGRLRPFLLGGFLNWKGIQLKRLGRSPCQTYTVKGLWNKNPGMP